MSVVVITGAARGIGRCIAERFMAQGTSVAIIDKDPLPYALPSDSIFFQGDIAEKQVIEDFVRQVVQRYERVNYIINNALPIMVGIDACSYEQFVYAQKVGVVAPFYLVKQLKNHLAEGASVVNIASSRDRMSMPQTESYTAAKGGVAALTHALAMSLAGQARVNSISPGWIDTAETHYEGPDAMQHPVGRVGRPDDIAHLVLYLCSPQASFITGENICVDGGMTHQMIYNGEHGWNLTK